MLQETKGAGSSGMCLQLFMVDHRIRRSRQCGRRLRLVSNALSLQRTLFSHLQEVSSLTTSQSSLLLSKPHLKKQRVPVLKMCHMSSRTVQQKKVSLNKTNEAVTFTTDFILFYLRHLEWLCLLLFVFFLLVFPTDITHYHFDLLTFAVLEFRKNIESWWTSCKEHDSTTRYYKSSQCH